jgi:hypothetical protein
MCNRGIFFQAVASFWERIFEKIRPKEPKIPLPLFAAQRTSSLKNDGKNIAGRKSIKGF